MSHYINRFVIDYEFGVATLFTPHLENAEARFVFLASQCFGIRISIGEVKILANTAANFPEYWFNLYPDAYEILSHTGGDIIIWNESGEKIKSEHTNLKITAINLREALAGAQHAIWAQHWMKYLFSCCERSPGGNLSIPFEKVNRWTRQINTDYVDLTEQEKESDRHQADKILRVLDGHKG
jgi:hypothetical protein